MKIALIADIHGNSIALEAVLADASSQQPDLYVFLGDIVDGHNPSGVLEMITQLHNTRLIAGNTEHYIMTGQGPPTITLEAVRNNPDRLPIFQQSTASFAWSKGWLCATGWFDWLLTLPLEERIELPDGQILLCVHASPGYADGPGIGPHTSDVELSKLLEDCTANVVCVGHTHVPFIRTNGTTTVINPGSVSNPLAPDLRASYAILTANADGFTISHRRVAYDHQAVIDAVKKSHHPSASYIIDFQVGKRTVERMMKGAATRRQLLKPKQ